MSEWQPIDSAPKDGTVVDLWIGGEFAGRRASCFWGKPEHDCGEHGRYCDSDWHDLDEGWVDDMNMPLDGYEPPTHWMHLPPPPDPPAIEPEPERDTKTIDMFPTEG
ncbi:hypothetical protein [Paraburkholderia atlantica]|uniref:hypothetical protein n=1 Tax=Paraburkholderia atlantica TaxID=2654982 RepID=UPI00161F4047|nr:hypothetical protein [Paraburkholderia atlantica]MBB5414043.1 hypothetical protein [Paraburkholderia atlantica]